MSSTKQYLNYTKGEEFFDQLKTRSSKKIYCSLYDYMKSVTQEINDEQQSFYVLNLADIIWKIQLWREKLPGITPFYAVKANADPILIRLFVLLGFSFDCSTKGEISLILENGGNPRNIIYAHTVKPSTSVKYASEVGVELMTFDSEEELFKIQNHYPNAKLVLRIKSENPHCSYDLSIKYGCPVLDAEKLLKQAKQLNLDVIGVSFHVGALCNDSNSYTKSIHSCRLIFDIAQQLGFQFTLLDLGGGFYGTTEKEKFFEITASEIEGALKRYFPENNVRIIAEPGCFFVGSAQQNVTCVLGRKSMDNSALAVNGFHKDDMSNNIERHYFLNDGIYGSFFWQYKLYGISLKPLLDPQELMKRPVYKSKIWGQTCCCEDVIQKECLLPDMKTGEFVIWENMGAYTTSLCSPFTLAPAPASRHVFLRDSRLHLDWIKNLDEVAEFITENAVLVESEDFP